MVVVHDLDERLHSSSARNLSSGHGLGDLQGDLVNTSEDGVSVGSLGSVVTLVVILQNNCLTASEFTASDDDDLTGL